MAVTARLRERLSLAVRRLRGWQDVERLKALGLRVGEDAYIGNGTYLDPDFCHLITIGDRAAISLNVTVLAHDAAARPIIGYSRVAPVTIGDDVFIGINATILPGVTVGDGAIIAAGAVVIRDVPAGGVVAGNPAKVVTDRDTFAARQAEKLERLPSWPRDGWTVTTGIDAARVAEVRAALAEHGEGFIG